MGYSEHDNETLCFIEGGLIFYQLTDYYILMSSALRNFYDY
jgi:hypothetical protein